MTRKPSRLGRLWTRQELPLDGQDAPDAPAADLDQLWQRAYQQALAAGNQDAMARRIADDVVRHAEERDHTSRDHTSRDRTQER